MQIKIFSYIVTIFRFICTVLVHKYCIFLTGVQINRKLKGTGISIPLSRLIKHDLSKFSPIEFWPFVSFYYGIKNTKKYEKAWLHHFTVNDYHWKHYLDNYKVGMILSEINPQNIKEMGNEAILEMATDWLSREPAYKGRWPIPGQWVWAQNSIKTIVLHPISKKKFIALLNFLGFGSDIHEESVVGLERMMHWQNLKLI